MANYFKLERKIKKLTNVTRVGSHDENRTHDRPKTGFVIYPLI